MSISGKDLHTKVRKLLPGISSGITPEVLNKVCDDPAAQQFLQWFCSNVGHDNCLTPEDIQLTEHIKKKGEWLEGEELDLALAEATKDRPELIKLLSVDSASFSKLSDELKAEKEAYKEDTDYLRTMEDSLKNLKELGLKLDDDIETEELQLEKDEIMVNKIYADCERALEELDSRHREFFCDIESLVEVYADAIEKKSKPVLWTQVPLENLIKQLEMHNECLEIYAKRHFGYKVEGDVNSDRDTITNDKKERCDNEKEHELLNCQANIIRSKTDEINAKMREAASAAVAERAIDIYNNSSTMIPQSEAQFLTEIAELTVKRDFHTENIELMLNAQLKEVVGQYAKSEITKIIVDDCHAQAGRRKSRLETLEKFRTLARERGHGYSDLLCILMQLQLRRLKQIIEFVKDARYYLATDYGLSSIRSDCMLEQQAKYDAIVKSSPREQNIFNKIFISLILGTDGNPNDLSVATKGYDESVVDNEQRKKNLLGARQDTKITKLKRLQDEILSIYDAEIKGPTNSLKPMSYELSKRLDESTKCVRDMQETIIEIRAKFKDTNKKTLDNSFERDTTIMWQRFLANHSELQSRYDEVKKKVENSHFSAHSDM